MSLLTSPTPFGAAVRGGAPAASAAAWLLPLGSRAALHVALARKGGVSSRTQRRLEERGKKRRGGGSVTAPAPPDMDEDTAGEGVDWEGEPLGFEVSTTPMPELPDPEKPDFWEGPQWEALGFFVQYMWAFGVFFGVSTSSPSIACRFSELLVPLMRFVQISAVLLPLLRVQVLKIKSFIYLV
ncbi:hypothetical protein E2562_001426 [Oryza meyeriana var. granulata]|uniref:Uncharacterized protein n=1 Tax=Oryza meyeriana var. granulata TaxID=110450 RepID=A0A6G1DDH9_9ORYZ|nr:hypothetical protein E2562_001426 [Oryza meyeriana var. granulata]